MFLGGADNENTAELRPTSIKGALRFWFRAINYGKYQDYKKVKEVEDELFGSTTSQSSFFLKLDTKYIRSETEQKRKELLPFGISYLGYGLDYEKVDKNERGQKKKVRLLRNYLIPGKNFTMELLIKPKYQDQLNVEDLIKPIKALGLFGGLGSRSRRGFGSVTLDSIFVDDKKCWVAPNSKEELRDAFKGFYSSLELNNTIPEYTAFSCDSRTIILDEFDNYNDALENVGRAMMDFRRECNEDTHIVLDYLHGCNVDKHPDRVVFGLPHNYFISGKGKVDINSIIGSERTRRSSPLFIKIIYIKGNNSFKYIPVLTVFPSEFLPKGSKISLKGERRGRVKVDPKILDPKASYNLINNFMDTFPNRLEVTPLD